MTTSTMPPYVTTTAACGLDIDYLSLNDGLDGLIVLMSNALVPGREDRRFPAFHRWSWAGEWLNCTVLVFADPALKLSSIPDGAWYLHREFDTIRAITEIVTSEAQRRGISTNRIVYFGSSLGGYAALAAASAGHAHAIAEVPQINVLNWFPGAVKKIEDHILGIPVAELQLEHPERVDVWSRFQYEKHVPSFTIYSNETDKSFDDQLALIGKVRGSALYSKGTAELVITARTSGHQVLVKDVAIKLVAEALARL